MSVDVETNLLENSISDLLAKLMVFQGWTVSLWELIRVNTLSLANFLLDLIHFVEKDGVMENIHLPLIAIVECLNRGHVVLSVKKLIQEEIILNVWTILSNIECSIISNIFRHAILIIII